MANEERELELVNLAVSGDPEALQAVISLWGPRVRRFASRFCPATEILDAVQETLVLLAERIHTLRAAEALTSWSFQVVKRTCVRAFSLLRRDSSLAQRLGVLEASTDPHRSLLVSELIRVVGLLPRRDREVLTLRDLQGLSNRETGLRLEIDETAVKSRLHRARARLKDQMLSSPLVLAVLTGSQLQYS